jgi:hypothetical protein
MKQRPTKPAASPQEPTATSEIRIPKKPAGAVAGAVVGAVVGGPLGAAIGGVVGTLVAAKSENGTLKLPRRTSIKKLPAAARRAPQKATKGTKRQVRSFASHPRNKAPRRKLASK